MIENITVRTTFAQDTKITPEIIKSIADISRDSLTSVKDRKEASDKYYDMLRGEQEVQRQDNQ